MPGIENDAKPQSMMSSSLDAATHLSVQRLLQGREGASRWSCMSILTLPVKSAEAPLVGRERSVSIDMHGVGSAG